MLCANKQTIQLIIIIIFTAKLSLLLKLGVSIIAMRNIAFKFSDTCVKLGDMQGCL